MKLHLELTNDPGTVIPINYNYQLTSALYKMIQDVFPEHARFIHRQKASFWTFSHLQNPSIKVKNDKLYLMDPNTSLVIGSSFNTTLTALVYAFIKNHSLSIHSQFGKVDFHIGNISSQIFNDLKQVKWDQEMLTLKYKTISPVLLRIPEQGKPHPQHIMPDHPQFVTSLIDNVWSTMTNIIKYEQEDEYPDIRVFKSMGRGIFFDFNFEGLYKQKLVTLKNDYKAKCSMFSFQLTAHRAIHKLIWSSGIGHLRNQGFGCLELT